MPIIIATAGTHPPALQTGAKYQNKSNRTSGTKMTASGTQNFSVSGGRASAVIAAITTYTARSRNHSCVAPLALHIPARVAAIPPSSTVLVDEVAAGTVVVGFETIGFVPELIPLPELEPVVGAAGLLVKPGAIIEPSGATVNDTTVMHVGLPGGEDRSVSETGSPVPIGVVCVST